MKNECYTVILPCFVLLFVSSLQKHCISVICIPICVHLTPASSIVISIVFPQFGHIHDLLVLYNQFQVHFFPHRSCSKNIIFTILLCSTKFLFVLSQIKHISNVELLTILTIACTVKSDLLLW